MEIEVALGYGTTSCVLIVCGDAGRDAASRRLYLHLTYRKHGITPRREAALVG
jgi:hypothetical protein